MKSSAEIRELDFWSLPEFAKAICGRTSPWVYARLTVDATGRAGSVRLPGGVEVPVSRDHNSRWMVARFQYDLAIRRAEEAS